MAEPCMKFFLEPIQYRARGCMDWSQLVSTVFQVFGVPQPGFELSLPVSVACTLINTLSRHFSNFFISRTPNCKVYNAAKLTNVVFGWQACRHISTDVHLCFICKEELLLTRCRNTQLDCYGQKKNLCSVFEKNSCTSWSTYAIPIWEPLS